MTPVPPGPALPSGLYRGAGSSTSGSGSGTTTFLTTTATGSRATGTVGASRSAAFSFTYAKRIDDSKRLLCVRVCACAGRVWYNRGTVTSIQPLVYTTSCLYNLLFKTFFKIRKRTEKASKKEKRKKTKEGKGENVPKPTNIIYNKLIRSNPENTPVSTPF